MSKNEQQETTTTPSDEELRKLLKPNPTRESVVEAIQKGYDKTVQILKQLDSYDDVNFLVQDDDGGALFLAKVHNGVESLDYTKNGQDSSIYLQNSIMQHLNQHGIPTSDPVVSQVTKKPLAVASLAVVSGPPKDLVVRLLSWLPGKPMSSLPFLPMESLIDAGRFLGEMDSKLDLMKGEECKAARRFHAWDGKNTLVLRDYTRYIANKQRREMVESILDAFQCYIVDKGVEFRTGILQADFNDANILVDDNFKVSGVIDFGDSVESWRVLDVSVGMAYSMLSAYGKNGRAIGAASAMLRGYNSIYPLQNVEREHLHLLMTCRLACSATLGAYSYQQNPENKYLLLHAEPAWKTLELVWGYDTERRVAIKAAVDRMFDKACSYSDTTDFYCSDLALPDPFVVDVMSSVRDTNNSSDSSDPLAKRQKTSDKNPVITFVTGNKKKLEEVKRILGDDGPFTVTNRKLDLPELQGDPIDIAKSKCSEAARQVGGAVITEDTSLCFTALKELPGPYIKWFLDRLGHDGLNNLIASSDDKSAYAQTLVAFCPGPGQDVVVFDGRTMGKIVPARGSLDFGWDPIFEPNEGGGLTYAEMTKEGKDAISHRSRAFSQLRDYFMKEQESISSYIN